ncbi:MAG: hypothetical protein AAFV69_00320 [Pseudomonadota bacterium]
MNPALGVDIGGVLIRPARSEEDTSFFSSDYLETPEVEGGFEALRQLNEIIFEQSVYLVSKARPTTAQKTREWLEHHDFYERTGLSPEHVYFCEKRKDKAPIAENLGLSAFIDDRPDVLGHLETVENKILFAESEEWLPNGARRMKFNVCTGWHSVLECLFIQYSG